MTCASCAVHIERRLNKLKGVGATVNFAVAPVEFTSLFLVSNSLWLRRFQSNRATRSEEREEAMLQP